MVGKNLFRKGFLYLTNKDYRFIINGTYFGMYHDMPDEQYLKRMFLAKMGYELNLENPKTFNEKLQWLKLYDRNPLYTFMVDKYEVKKYVAERIGNKYVIPTLGIWDHFDEIDFKKLPNQFVLKCTHDSGGLSICEDISIWDKLSAKKSLEKCLKRNYYYNMREWAYKNVKPRILAEKYLVANKTKEIIDGEVKDRLKNTLIEYKLFCVFGQPKWFLVSMGSPHGEGRFNDFYDIDFNHIPVTVTQKNAPFILPKPKEYDELIHIAKCLSKNIPHVRVDTYVLDGHIFVGEMTFFHAAGFCQFKPKDYDSFFGNILKLPNIQN